MKTFIKSSDERFYHALNGLKNFPHVSNVIGVSYMFSPTFFYICAYDWDEVRWDEWLRGRLVVASLGVEVFDETRQRVHGFVDAVAGAGTRRLYVPLVSAQHTPKVQAINQRRRLQRIYTSTHGHNHSDAFAPSWLSLSDRILPRKPDVCVLWSCCKLYSNKFHCTVM